MTKLCTSTLRLVCACTQRVAAERLLLQVQEHPQAWQRVDVILASAQSQSTKYFALQGRAGGRWISEIPEIVTAVPRPQFARVLSQWVVLELWRSGATGGATLFS